MTALHRVHKRVSDVLYQWGPARYYQPAYRQIASGLRIKKGAYLDVGCGPGWLCIHVGSHHPEIQAVGIDHSGAMLKAARRNAGGRANIRFRQMAAESMEFPDSTFDVVTAIQTAHHWSDQFAILSQVHRVLKPGGRFYLYEADRDADRVPEGWVKRWRGMPPDWYVRKGWNRFGMNDEEWAEIQVTVRSLGFSNHVQDRHGFYRRLVLHK